MTEIERPSPNSARTTRTYPLTPANLLDIARRAVERLPRWSVSSRDANAIKAVRATRLIRFKDDVTVRVEPHAEGAGAEFHSASRIGKGDLGQNPRNIRELLEAIDRELGPRN